MIIYRQKQYSSGLAKSMFKLEKIKDRFHTKTGDRIFRRISDGLIHLKNYGEDIINPDRVKSARNRLISKTQYNRPSQARRALLKEKAIKDSLINTRNTVESIVYNPGGAVNRTAKATLRNPIAVTSQAAGKVTMAIDPTGLGAYPIGVGGTALEHLAKKGYPEYNRFTKKVANGYGNKVGKYVEPGTNIIVNSLKSLG